MEYIAASKARGGRRLWSVAQAEGSGRASRLTAAHASAGPARQLQNTRFTGVFPYNCASAVFLGGFLSVTCIHKDLTKRIHKDLIFTFTVSMLFGEGTSVSSGFLPTNSRHLVASSVVNISYLKQGMAVLPHFGDDIIRLLPTFSNFAFSK